MSKRIVCLLIAVAVFLCGCGRTETAYQESPNELPTEEPTTEMPYYQREVYYENAVVDYLDFDSSSWAREYQPEFLMIHFTSAVVIDRDDPYNMELNRSIFEDYEIGINYIIDRDGTVFCYLPENRAAWHAGEGEFNGEERLTNRMNMYSIGIEVLAIGSESDMAQYLTSYEYRSLDSDFYGYTEAQYVSLKLLTEDICARHNIPMDRNHIIGHEEYSPEKSDPGELFDWGRIVEEGN